MKQKIRCVEFDSSITVEIKPDTIMFKRDKKTLTIDNHSQVKVTKEDQKLFFEPLHHDKPSKALTGTMHALARNHCQGLMKPYEFKLEIRGVGYKASLEKDQKGNHLKIALGKSHFDYVYEEDGITIECPKPTIIYIKGACKNQVSQFATNIKNLRPLEPYKLKGIILNDKMIKQKERSKS